MGKRHKVILGNQPQAMILTCPNCATRYVLSSVAIGSEGRTVRCAKCKHDWYQEPQELEEDENLTSFDDVDEDDTQEHVVEDIPEGVKPRPEKTNVPAFAADVLRPQAGLQAKMAGYFAALMIFSVLLSGAFFYKINIVTAWPPAAALYQIAGIGVNYQGQDLVVEDLSAELIPASSEKGIERLILKGRVVNLTANSVRVPKMLAILRSTNGEEGEQWVIDSPVDQVEPGASFAFTSEYAGVPRGVGSVNLTFAPTISGG